MNIKGYKNITLKYINGKKYIHQYNFKTTTYIKT